MRARSLRPASSLMELLVVLAIVAVLLGLLIPAVVQIRESAARQQCANNLRQLGLALHLYHQDRSAFPPGVRISVPKEPLPYLGWHARLLPYLDQQPLWDQVQRDYRVNPFPFLPPLHQANATILATLTCPTDSRLITVQTFSERPVALTSYLGVEGTNFRKKDGLLYLNSRTRITDVRDGLSKGLSQVAGGRADSCSPGGGSGRPSRSRSCCGVNFSNCHQSPVGRHRPWSA